MSSATVTAHLKHVLNSGSADDIFNHRSVVVLINDRHKDSCIAGARFYCPIPSYHHQRIPGRGRGRGDRNGGGRSEGKGGGGGSTTNYFGSPLQVTEARKKYIIGIFASAQITKHHIR